MSRNDKDQVVPRSLTLHDFKTWCSVALKTFLSLRNRSVNGSVDVLRQGTLQFYIMLKQSFIQRNIVAQLAPVLSMSGWWCLGR